MSTTPAEFATAVAVEVPNFFSDTLDALGQGEGAYLRDGQPQSATSRIGQAVGRAACRRYGQNPEFVNGVPQTRFEKACRPYLDSISPRDGGGPKLPYRGGQCPVRYLVFATSNGIDLNIGGQTPLNILGPLGSPVFATQVIGSPFPDSTRYTWTFPNDPATVLQFTSRAQFTPNPGFRVAGRTGGGADDCGNPEPVIIPPDPLPDPQPPPFRFNPTPDIDVDIDVDVNPDGTIDFDFGVGPITVDPFGDGGGGGGGGGGAPPGDVGQPGAAADGDGEPVEGEAEPGDVLGGLLVEVLAPAEGSSEFFGGNLRGQYYVYMGTPDGLAQVQGSALVRPTQFFLPPQENLTRWQVLPRADIGVRVTPYYRTPEEQS